MLKFYFYGGVVGRDIKNFRSGKRGKAEKGKAETGKAEKRKGGKKRGGKA
jgi:hypothetical protein